MIDQALASRMSGGRVVWAGRAQERPFGSLDGWNCDRVALYDLLEDASELVILDPLSFPWESVGSSIRDIPTTTVLPATLDADGISGALGGVLLNAITKFDRLVEPRSDVRRALQVRWPIHDVCWTTGSHPWGALSSASGKEPLVEVETPFGTFIAIRDDLITEHLSSFGAHQRGLLNAVLAITDATDLFVDVGAHIGTITIPLAAKLGLGRSVVVEGNPSSYWLLRENISRNGLSAVVTSHNVVLAESIGKRLPRQVPGNTGGNSFTQSGTLGRRPDSVYTSTLDDLLADEDVERDSCVVKLDVEGNELRVLCGAEDFVRRANPILVIEVADAQLRSIGDTKADLDDWLKSRGYELYRVAGARNFEGGSWSLEPIASLRSCTEGLFDVVGVPRSSRRAGSFRLVGSHEGASHED